jgi:hypothetical protein
MYREQRKKRHIAHVASLLGLLGKTPYLQVVKDLPKESAYDINKKFI